MTWTDFCKGLRDVAESRPVTPATCVTLEGLKMVTPGEPVTLTPLGWLWLGRVTDHAPARELEAYAAAFSRALDHIHHAADTKGGWCRFRRAARGASNVRP